MSEAPPTPSAAGLKPVVIVGPTASGKTEIALRVARLIGGEIVSVDSRQIYRRLDAGTAKPPGAWVRRGPDELYEVEGMPYHLVDFLDPREEFDAQTFSLMASRAMDEIRARGKVPVLAGGAGMYLQALFNGLDPLPPRSPEIRARLEAELSSAGPAPLAERLRRADPASADWAGANPRRLTRALEVLEASGKPISQHWSGAFLKDLPADQALFIGLQWESAELQERIERRTRELWPALVAECRRLLEEGFKPEDPGLRTLGYPEGIAAVIQKASFEDARASLIKSTLRYAKRQRTWFRRYKSLAWMRPEPGLADRIARLARKA